MANPRKLVDGGLTTSDVVAFAGNHLTVIVPADNPAGIGSPEDLARPGVRIIACAKGVPVERYTAQVLDRLVSVAGYPAGYPDAYRANVVSGEDNVGAIVTKVGLGEGDAGIVYATDARSSEAVEMIEIPAEANVPATYGGVVIGASGSSAAAAAFLAWVAGPEGQAILSSFGFLPVS
jgi:molybdate transport system substrate-binding protein